MVTAGVVALLVCVLVLSVFYYVPRGIVSCVWCGQSFRQRKGDTCFYCGDDCRRWALTLIRINHTSKKVWVKYELSVVIERNERV